jgi:DNA-directed RNA polymerase subunit F
LSSRVVEEHYVPYSVAKKLLSQVMENSQDTSNLLQKTMNYLIRVDKCEAEEAEILMQELSDVVEREDIRAIISSICPISIDEMRSILAIETGKTYSTEEVEKIIELVKKHLKS